MKNLIRAAVVTLFAVSTAHGQAAVQWKVTDGGNGHWYQTVRLPTPCAFDSAARIARSVGGHLATISTETELNLIGSFDSPQAGAWTGGVVQNSGCYLGPDGCNIPCVGGEPIWESGEPWYAPLGNYVNCWGGGRYGLAAANGGFRWQPVWVDQYVNPIDSLIVEWDADCNADGIVDYGQCQNGTLPDYNGNNVPDCCERGEACVVGSYPVQWRVADGGNGHWYQAQIFDDATWTQAVIACETAGGGLVCITTSAEWDMVTSLYRATGVLHPAHMWTGGQKAEGNSQWEWRSGETWGFTAWGGAECPSGPYPNNPQSESLALGISEACGVVWDDYNPLSTKSSDFSGWVIEWSADCNSDGIVDYGQIMQDQLADTNIDGIPDTCQCGTIPSLPACCPGDLDHDRTVGGADIGLLLSNWGPCGSACLYDLNNDNKVNGGDLGLLLAGWGPCQG